MKKKNIYLSEIDKFISYLNKLSDADIEKISNNIVKIKYELTPEKKRNSGNFIEFSKMNLNPKDVITELEKLSSRRDGELYLQEKLVNKQDYEAVAKSLDLSFDKKDSIEMLKKKIIEGTIGFRLNSQAIQKN